MYGYVCTIPFCLMILPILLRIQAYARAYVHVRIYSSVSACSRDEVLFTESWRQDVHPRDYNKAAVRDSRRYFEREDVTSKSDNGNENMNSIRFSREKKPGSRQRTRK